MSAAAPTPAYRRVRLLLCLAAALAVLAMHGPSSGHLLTMPMPASTAAAMAVDGAAPHRLHPGQSPGQVSSADRIAVLRSDSGMGSSAHPDCLATRRGAPVPLPPVSLAVLSPGWPTQTTPAARMRVARRGPPKPSLDRLCISRT